ncbi:hypothetical protein Sjap_018037 [Stephania japonica]|uniref:Carbohydrate kinase PfkB domain-containing protein n=1 Tax=Stephania japonica TaxID=461633 RepID=A0AAP0I7B3_9MAGN
MEAGCEGGSGQTRKQRICPICGREEPVRQPIIAAKKVVDTTGAGDTFTAAFAVVLVEGKSKQECLEFAAAAASLRVQVKGTIPSMPARKAVLDLLASSTTGHGVTHIRIGQMDFSPHRGDAAQAKGHDERFYFGDHIFPCFETGIPLLKQRLHQLPDAENISIAFPDDGAWKRFYKQLLHFPMV